MRIELKLVGPLQSLYFFPKIGIFEVLWIIGCFPKYIFPEFDEAKLCEYFIKVLTFSEFREERVELSSFSEFFDGS